MNNLMKVVIGRDMGTHELTGALIRLHAQQISSTARLAALRSRNGVTVESYQQVIEQLLPMVTQVTSLIDETQLANIPRESLLRLFHAHVALLSDCKAFTPQEFELRALEVISQWLRLSATLTAVSDAILAQVEEDKMLAAQEEGAEGPMEAADAEEAAGQEEERCLKICLKDGDVMGFSEFPVAVGSALTSEVFVMDATEALKIVQTDDGYMLLNEDMVAVPLTVGSRTDVGGDIIEVIEAV